MTKFLWCGIMKNERARLLRAAESVRAHICGIAITDTGSTDDSPSILEDWAKIHDIPCVIGHAPFENFSQARNAGLALARSSGIPYNYLLLMDMDMQLVVQDPHWADDLHGIAYDMYQTASVLSYQNRRLLSFFSKENYIGVTHEYLNVATAGCIPREKAYFVDHADGANRPDKFRRDIDLFKKALLTDPDNVRTFYYLAQSYRDAGEPAEAVKWYKKRIDAGGWDEEVWSAMECMAHCYKDMGSFSDFVFSELRAYNFRPSRAESIYNLAKFWRERGENYLAVLFAEAGLDIPPSNDALFVNDYVSHCGLKEEFSISAFYVPGKRPKGFDICDELAIANHPYAWSRQLAEINLVHYLLPLSEWCPSFRYYDIEFVAEENWIAMNPSVALHVLPDQTTQLKCLVRTVNYRMDEEGRYLIRGTDGTITNANPINTRTFLVPLSNDLRTITQIEVVPPPGLPLNYPLVVGFEDMRLFTKGHDLWTVSTVRQFDADGIAEQVLARIGGVPGGGTGFTLELTDIHRMRREPRLYEKNWAPFVKDDQIRFMYRPGHVVDAKGQDVSKVEAPFAVGGFSGSSSLIEVEGFWLGVIHEARYHLGTTRRYYQHRFVLYDSLDFGVRMISKPFYFNDKVIEFAAGIAKHPSSDDLIISYGWKDCVARLARVSQWEVMKFIKTEGQKCG